MFQIRLKTREVEVWDEDPTPSLQRSKESLGRKAAFKSKSLGVVYKPFNSS